MIVFYSSACVLLQYHLRPDQSCRAPPFLDECKFDNYKVGAICAWIFSKVGTDRMAKVRSASDELLAAALSLAIDRSLMPLLWVGVAGECSPITRPTCCGMLRVRAGVTCSAGTAKSTTPSQRVCQHSVSYSAGQISPCFFRMVFSDPTIGLSATTSSHLGSHAVDTGSIICTGSAIPSRFFLHHSLLQTQNPLSGMSRADGIFLGVAFARVGCVCSHFTCRHGFSCSTLDLQGRTCPKQEIHPATSRSDCVFRTSLEDLVLPRQLVLM